MVAEILHLDILRLSSIGSCLKLNSFEIWFGPLNFILRKIDLVVVVIFNFNILRSSYIGGRLPLKVTFHWKSSSIGGHFPLI